MEHICKNCGSLYEGNYCNLCGQKAKVGKLTLRSVLDNWAYGLTNCDTGILFTYKELFTRPGHMLGDYICGKRVIYFQPFPMLFITAGLYGLLSQILVPSIEKEVVPAAAMLTFQERFLHLLATWINTSMSFTAIITLPLFAWAAQLTFRVPHFHPFIPNKRQFLSAWAYHQLVCINKNRLCQLSGDLFISTYNSRIKYLHRKYDYNFTEYIFIFAYIACQRLVVGIFLIIPILAFTNSSELTKAGNWGIYSIYFLLLLWDLKQLFHLDIRKALGKTLQLLLNWCLILLMFAFSLAGIIAIIFYIGKKTALIPGNTVEEIINNL